jgi:hypothetical protein
MPHRSCLTSFSPCRNQRSLTIHPKQNAQYVRVQLAGTNTLLLAEVEIRGFAPIQSWQHLEGARKWTQVQTHRIGIHTSHWHSRIALAFTSLSAALLPLNARADSKWL